MAGCFVVDMYTCPRVNGRVESFAPRFVGCTFGRRYRSTPTHELAGSHNEKSLVYLKPVERVEDVLVYNAALAQHRSTETVYTAVSP